MDVALRHRASPGDRIIALVLIASLGSLAFAFAGEHLFGLEPCILCLYERIPYGIAALLAGAALLMPSRNRWQSRLLAGIAVVFILSAGLALYHVGVEQHWWRSVAACGGTLATDIGDLRNLSATDLKPCDQVDWRLFGLSLAGYNVLASLALAAVALLGVRMLIRKG